jgi:hypothetical protein
MQPADRKRPITLEDLDLAFAKSFGQLVAYLDLDKRFERKADKEQVSQILTTMDGIAKRIDEDDQDRALNDAQLDRHGRWIGDLAATTGTQLSQP